MKTKLKNILLIEDNMILNFLHKSLIEKMNIAEEIHFELNGQEALSYLNIELKRTFTSCFPDIIFLDLNMPVMGGWEFLDEYKKLCLEKGIATPLYILTSSPNPDDEERASNIKEVSGFFQKPLTEEMLSTIIEKQFIKLE